MSMIFEGWVRETERILLSEIEDPNIYQLIQLRGEPLSRQVCFVYSRGTLEFLRRYLIGADYSQLDPEQLEGAVDRWRVECLVCGA